MKKFCAMFPMSAVMFAGAFAAMNQQASETMTVEVYYESISKNSEEFITKQLYPTYIAINKGYLPMNPPMKLQLIPYGDCHVKDIPVAKRKTCAYNKLHACAISLSSNENNWTPLNYINCLMTKHEAHNDAPLCALKTCFDDRLMAPCVNTVDGDKLMMAHRNRTTGSKSLTGDLPVITFDGVYKADEQGKARTNLLALVCNKMKEKTAACRAARASETMTHNNFGSGFYYPERIHCYFWINNRHCHERKRGQTCLKPENGMAHNSQCSQDCWTRGESLNNVVPKLGNRPTSTDMPYEHVYRIKAKDILITRTNMV